MTQLFVCTGEVSGDLQASHLIKALLKQRPSLQISAVGGERMAKAGAQLIHQTTAISSFGLLEALPFIGPALWAEWKIWRFLKQHRPDLCILIDYIGVNSRISNILDRQRIPAVYYIAPQEWVWTANPALSYQLAKRMRLMLAIFPEEARYYEQAGGNVRWVGHPLIDILQQAPTRIQARAQLGISDQQVAVMLFPASRIQEVRLIAPVLFAAARLLQDQLPHIRFWLPLASKKFEPDLARQAKEHGLSITFLESQESHLVALAAADLVLAKSGTVNLETAILGIPQVVIYRLSRLTYWIGNRILKVTFPFASPPNLVQMRLVVPEFIQDQAQPELIMQAGYQLLTDPQRQAQLQQDYQQMRLALGQPGVLERAASEILRVLDGSG